MVTPLPSLAMTKAIRGPGRDREHDVRRLRDLLRSSVLRLAANAELPSEGALMSEHGVSRGVVREALSLLRTEGLIERRQGLGTHTVSSTFVLQLDEAHGAVEPRSGSMLDRRMRPRILTSAFVPLPAHAAQRLDTLPGATCLLLEYLNLVDDEPIALATNYVIEPEASRIFAAPFVTDWYALLEDAGCPLGGSQVTWDAVLSDSTNSALLDVDEGRPLMAMEQIVHDPSGRPFDVAFVHLRADRWRLASRFWRRP